MSNLAVVSAGSYGTALARVLADNGHRISLHVRETDTYEVIKARRINATYLPGVELPVDKIHATTELAEAVRGAEIVLLTVPAQYAEETMAAFKVYLEPKAIAVLTSKGMVGNGVTISEIAAQELPDAQLCGLYGITFAKFIAQSNGLSSMSIAAADEGVARTVAGLFMNHTSSGFRIYLSNDLRGVEFGGAMKNVYATTMGIVDGYFAARIGPPASATEVTDVNPSRHSLLSFCIREFIEFGLMHGADLHTLLGPAGSGDIQACANNLSRNYQYGRWRASLELQGEVRPAPAQHEGYDTVKAAMVLAQKYGFEAPLLKVTHDILFNPVVAKSRRPGRGQAALS